MSSGQRKEVNLNLLAISAFEGAGKRKLKHKH